MGISDLCEVPSVAHEKNHRHAAYFCLKYSSELRTAARPDEASNGRRMYEAKEPATEVKYSR